MTDYYRDIKSREQRQDALSDQLQDLVRVANRLGMYDAADFIEESIETDRVKHDGEVRTASAGSESTETWTKEEIEENRLTHQWLQGQYQGWAQAAGFLREKAANGFKRGKDDEAHLLRDLAEELAKESRERDAKAAEYEKSYCTVEPGGVAK